MLYQLSTAGVLFIVGLSGVFMSRRNVILTIMSLEVMLLSVTFNMIFFATYLDDILGHVVTLFLLTVGASESAIGLALIITYYRRYE